MSGIITQRTQEVVIRPSDSNARVSQKALEVVSSPKDANILISQGIVEIVVGLARPVRVSNLLMEIIYPNPTPSGPSGMRVLGPAVQCV
jgi:hypothetical protein